MKGCNKQVGMLLDILTMSMEPGSSRKYDSKKGFMPLHVERLSENRFSIAHYFEANGDLVPDPDMELWRSPKGEWFPVALQLSLGTYTRALTFEIEAAPARYSPSHLRELVSFLKMWAANINEQQGPFKGVTLRAE
jgi:hypothetical protein